MAFFSFQICKTPESSMANTLNSLLAGTSFVGAIVLFIVIIILCCILSGKSDEPAILKTYYIGQVFALLFVGMVIAAHTITHSTSTDILGKLMPDMRMPDMMPSMSNMVRPSKA